MIGQYAGISQKSQMQRESKQTDNYGEGVMQLYIKLCSQPESVRRRTSWSIL